MGISRDSKHKRILTGGRMYKIDEVNKINEVIFKCIK